MAASPLKMVLVGHSFVNKSIIPLSGILASQQNLTTFTLEGNQEIEYDIWRHMEEKAISPALERLGLNKLSHRQHCRTAAVLLTQIYKVTKHLINYCGRPGVIFCKPAGRLEPSSIWQ